MRIFLAAAAAVASVPSLASAQSEADLGTRRVLLEQAEAARTGGNHMQALDAAQRAGRIQMTPSVRLFIAEELEALGRIAAAYGSADTCVVETERDTAARNRDAILQRCRTLRDGLRARIGYVRLVVPQALREGLQLSVDGQPVNEALWGVQSVATPGTVVVVATRRGQEIFHREVIVSVGATLDVAVDNSGTPSRGGHEGDRSQSTAGTARGAPVGPIVVLSTGALALGAAAVFYGLRQGALARCVVRADAVECSDPMALTTAQRNAPTFNLLTNVMLIGGAAVLATGVTWLILDRVAGGGPRRERPVAFVRPNAGGVTLELVGRF